MSTSAPAGAASALLGSVHTVDITPPIGMHLHNWAYAPTMQATGVHHPLEAKIVALGSRSSTERCLLVVLDLGWWMSADDEWRLRGSLLAATGLPEANVIVALTHTHSGPSINRSDADRPGGALIAPYLEDLQDRLAVAAAEALRGLVPVQLDWWTGACTLAENRDLFRADEQRYVVGDNPAGATDTTLLLGRMTRAGDGRPVAVIANYAVHPTSLGGLNTQLSPDLVGSARRIVEDATGAPFVFLQAASGDLAPRHQYSEELEVADRNGEALGHAVLSTLLTMDPPGTAPVYRRTIESGAPLGIWDFSPRSAAATIRCDRFTVSMETQSNAPAPSPVAAVDRDRRLRAERVSANVSARTTEFPVTLWELGEAVVLAHPGEAYSALQTTLRAEYPSRPLVVMNLANGAHHGYVAPEDAYDDQRYPAWQSPLARGSFERLLAACRATLADRTSRPHAQRQE